MDASPFTSPICCVERDHPGGTDDHPYLWTYDQVLLLVPIIFVVGQLAQRKVPFFVSVLFFLIFSIFSNLLLVLAVNIGNDVWSVTLSALIMIFVVCLIHDRPLVDKELSPIVGSALA